MNLLLVSIRLTLYKHKGMIEPNESQQVQTFWQAAFLLIVSSLT